MTRKEYVIKAIESPSDMNSDTILNLVKVAYWMGREQEAKKFGDKVKTFISDQVDRAKNCRYHKMALSVIGNYRIIYSGNYSGDHTEAFGIDETNFKIHEEAIV